MPPLYNARVLSVGGLCALAIVFGSVVRAQAAPSASLRIVSPANGAVVHPGDRLEVTADSDEPLLGMSATLGQGLPGALDGSPPWLLELLVPEDVATGVTRLRVVGFKQSGGIVDAATTVNVLPNGTLQKIEVGPSPLRFAVRGEDVPLAVTGLFSDGNRMDIAESARGTSYATLSGSGSVVLLSPDGVVSANNDGQDIIIVANGGLTAPVAVTVRVTNEVPTIQCPSLVTVIAGSSQQIQITSSDAGDDAITIDAIDVPSYGELTTGLPGRAVLSLSPPFGTPESETTITITALDDGDPPAGATHFLLVKVVAAPITPSPLATTTPQVTPEPSGTATAVTNRPTETASLTPGTPSPLSTTTQSSLATATPAEPSPTATTVATASPTTSIPTPTSSPTPTQSETPVSTPATSPTASGTPSGTVTPSASSTPSASLTVTDTPNASPTRTPQACTDGDVDTDGDGLCDREDDDDLRLSVQRVRVRSSPSDARGEVIVRGAFVPEHPVDLTRGVQLTIADGAGNDARVVWLRSDCTLRRTGYAICRSSTDSAVLRVEPVTGGKVRLDARVRHAVSLANFDPPLRVSLVYAPAVSPLGTNVVGSIDGCRQTKRATSCINH